MRNNQSDQGRRPRRIWKRLLTVLLTLVLIGTLAFFILLGVVLAGSHELKKTVCQLVQGPAAGGMALWKGL